MRYVCMFYMLAMAVAATAEKVSLPVVAPPNPSTNLRNRRNQRRYLKPSQTERTHESTVKKAKSSSSPTISHQPSIRPSDFPSASPTSSGAPTKSSKVKEAKCKKSKGDGRRFLHETNYGIYETRQLKHNGDESDESDESDETTEYVDCAPTTSPSPQQDVTDDMDSTATTTDPTESTVGSTTTSTPTESYEESVTTSTVATTTLSTDPPATTTTTTTTEPTESSEEIVTVPPTTTTTTTTDPPTTTTSTTTTSTTSTTTTSTTTTTTAPPTTTTTTTTTTEPPLIIIDPIDELRDSPETNTVPTPPPDPNSVPSPGCALIKQGLVYETNLTATLKFDYEVVVDNTVDIGETVGNLEGNVQRYMANTLVNCEGSDDAGGRRAQQVLAHSDVVGVKVIPTTLKRGGRMLVTDGVGAGAPDKVSETKGCSVLGQVGEGEACYYVEGEMDLYLREDSYASSKAESSMKALKELKESFNFDDKFVDEDNGIKFLYFVKGEMDGSDAVGGDGGSFNDKTDETTEGELLGGVSQNIKGKTNEDNTIGPVGGVLIGALSLGALVVAFIAFRRQRRSTDRVEEYYKDDESYDVSWYTKSTRDKRELLGYGKGSDATTEMTSNADPLGWKKIQPGHVLNEEDWFEMHPDPYDTSSIMKDLGKAEKANQRKSTFDAGSTGQSTVSDSYITETEPPSTESKLSTLSRNMNVHQCTSATCTLCNNSINRSPTFITADDDSITTSFMGSVQPSIMGSVQPSVMGSVQPIQRTYPLDDTIEL